MMVGIDVCNVDIPKDKGGDVGGRRLRGLLDGIYHMVQEAEHIQEGLECKETSQGAMRYGLSRVEDLIVDLTK
jgi:hypothetical protein